MRDEGRAEAGAQAGGRPSSPLAKLSGSIKVGMYNAFTGDQTFGRGVSRCSVVIEGSMIHNV